MLGIDAFTMFSFLKKKVDNDNCVETSPTNDCQYNKTNEELKYTVFDAIKTIKDPEKSNTLEELNVVYEDGVIIKAPTAGNTNVVRVEFAPTVPHCSLATLIGLCIRIKIQRSIPEDIKLDIFIKKGAHATEFESIYMQITPGGEVIIIYGPFLTVNKQINDKERIAAAMENTNLREMVEHCVTED